MNFELEDGNALDPSTLYMALEILRNCSTVDQARSKIQTLWMDTIEKELKKNTESNEKIMKKYEGFFPKGQRRIARNFKI